MISVTFFSVAPWILDIQYSIPGHFEVVNIHQSTDKKKMGII